jgi:hypothetical protein
MARALTPKTPLFVSLAETRSSRRHLLSFVYKIDFQIVIKVIDVSVSLSYDPRVRHTTTLTR